MINPAEAKRSFHDGLKDKWKASFERGRKAARTGESAPPRNFLNAISHNKLGRIDASHIAQFRVGLAPVNQYPKRIKRVDNTSCLACGDEEESAEHFLLPSTRTRDGHSPSKSESSESL